MVVIVVNKFAGRGRAEKAYKKEIIPYLEKKRMEYVTVMEDTIHKMQESIKRHLESGIKYVMVIGGDGTLNRVIESILGKGVVLIPFPGGTGNDFMKSMGKNKANLKRIVDCLDKSCKTEVVDVGFVKTEKESHIFINGLGIGFDAEVLRRLKKIPMLKGDALYFLSVIVSIFKRTGMYFDLYLEGKHLRMEDVVVFDVGNGKYLGGGFKLFPNSKFTDGILSFTAIKNGKLIKVFGVLLDIMKEKFNNSLIKMGEFKRLKAFFDREVFFHTDGDLIGSAREFEIGILEEKVRVLV